MADLIDRQTAIDALEKEKPTPFVNKDGSIDPFGAGRQNQWYRDGIAIMNLPSAQQWIPCSDERKPDLGVRVLLTSWSGEICLGWLDANGCWHTDDGVVAEGCEPLAWLDRKFPAPYKGGDADAH